MKMTENIKKKGAAVLAVVLAFSAAGLSSVYGAPGVETGRSCSLSFELDGQYEELNHTGIPVKLYQVAEIADTGEYEPLAGYESLELGAVGETLRRMNGRVSPGKHLNLPKCWDQSRR